MPPIRALGCPTLLKSVNGGSALRCMDLKHRGVTDTKGNRGDKQQASGHKTEQMLDVYDHEVPLVDAAIAPEF